MNKSELANALADEAKITEQEASGVIRVFFEQVEEALNEGRRFEIRGFGAFATKQYGGYKGRNPKSGELVEVRPKTLPTFRAGRELKEIVNKG